MQLEKNIVFIIQYLISYVIFNYLLSIYVFMYILQFPKTAKRIQTKDREGKE